MRRFQIGQIVRASSALGIGLFVVSVGFVTRASGTTWDSPQAIEFPAGVQHASPQVYFNSVSCSSAGNCTAVGSFRNTAGGLEAFTVTSTDGVWATAQPAVFASNIQDSPPSAVLRSVSCSSAGNCTAVGRFRKPIGGEESFTMTSTNGVWATAEPTVFASNVQDTTKDDNLLSVSCVSAGNCTAVGKFKAQSGGKKAFTVTSTNGVWATAEPIVFGAGIEHSMNPDTSFSSVSCVSVGNCTAVGQFKKENTLSDFEAFTVTSTDGVWATAQPVAFGAGIQNTNPDASFNSISCSSVENCTAVGLFKNTNGGSETFTVTSTNGVWATAEPAVFPNGVQSASLNNFPTSMTCTSVGNCVVVGQFVDSSSQYVAFTMTSTNGVWATAELVTFASGVQNVSPEQSLSDVSCSSPGNCVTVGSFRNISGNYEAFTMTSMNGGWNTAEPVAFASGVQNSTPDASLNVVSCVSIGTCTAVGRFSNASGVSEGFSVSASLVPAATTPAETPATTVPATTTTALTNQPSTKQPAQLPKTGDDSLLFAILGAFLVSTGFVLVRRRFAHNL